MIDQAVAEQPLQERIQSALSRNPYVSGKRVSCCADQGHVTLSGQVSSYFQKQMAQEAVRRFDGVERIENQLVVNRLFRDFSGASEETVDENLNQ